MNLDRVFAPYSAITTNLVDCLRFWAEVQPEKPAYYQYDGEDDETILTYQRLDQRARAIGAHLTSLGMRGRRALLLYPPGLEFIAGFFGCLYAGAIAVPAYPPRRNRNMERIQAISDDAKAKVALSVHDVVDRMEGMLDDAPNLRDLTWLGTDRIPDGDADQWRMPDLLSCELAVLQYTSGSTGKPKGVMLTHGNIMHNVQLIAHAFEPTRDTIGLSWLPTYHDMGLVGCVLKAMFYGCPSVLMSPMAFLQKPLRWLRGITRYRVTISGGPNFAFDLCTQKITDEQLEGLDLSSWVVAFNGAEPVRAGTLKRFTERFAPVGFRPEAFYPCYGMAETTLIVTGSVKTQLPVVATYDGKELDNHRIVPVAPDHPAARELVGCGRVLPDEDLAIVDPVTYTRLPDDRVGEIWVSSPSVALGYWQQTEATQQTFQAKLADSSSGGPYLRTGDLGFLHDGELFVTGRLKDLIIVRGVNRYPQDIELTVERSCKQLQPGAVGAFAVDLQGRERLIVVAEVERARRPDWADVIETIRRNVAAEHELPPDGIVLVRFGSIPKTSSGKIQRHACRDCFLQNTLSVVASWFGWDRTEGDEEARVAAAARSRDARPTPRLPVFNGRSVRNGVVPQEHSFVDLPELQRWAPRIAEWRSSGIGNLYATGSPNGAAANVESNGQGWLDFTSTDYLGLATEPAVLAAAKQAIDRYGTSASTAWLCNGGTAYQQELELELARFLGTEDAAIVESYSSAAAGLFSQLFSTSDLILCDDWASDGLLNAARASRATLGQFPHNDWHALDLLLKEVRTRHRRTLIAIESVSPVHGGFPELNQFVEIKWRHKAFLLLDQSHALGTLGAHGRGLHEHLGIDPREVDLMLGTLGNALGSGGGYVAGGAEVIPFLKHLVQIGRNVSPTPAQVAAAMAAFRLLQDEPARIARLQSRARLFHQLARQRQLDTGTAKGTPIVPWLVGNVAGVLQIASELLHRGIVVHPVLPPQTADNRAALRFCVTAQHSEAVLRQAVAAAAEAAGAHGEDASRVGR